VSGEALLIHPAKWHLACGFPVSHYTVAVVMAASAQHWYALRWFDWLNVFGLVLALIGLALTWRQARNAANSAKAAQEAVTYTEEQIRANQLMVLIPNLRWTIKELDSAIDGDSSLLARKQLENWRWQASNIHGILAGSSDADRLILESLIETTGLAVTAEEGLMDGKQTVGSGTVKARTAMARACDQLASWVGKQSTQVIKGGGGMA
jgi:hypothetical protein